MQSKREIQLEAVKAILSGELLIEEAMVKYNVKDKRTISSWVKKTIPILEMATDIPAYGEKATPPSDTDTDVPPFDVVRENTLLKKIIELQDRVSQLERKNTRLKELRDHLMEELSTSQRKHSGLYPKTLDRKATEMLS